MGLSKILCKRSTTRLIYYHINSFKSPPKKKGEFEGILDSAILYYWGEIKGEIITYIVDLKYYQGYFLHQLLRQ